MAGAALKAVLVEAGLPPAPPGGAGSRGRTIDAWPVAAAVVLAVGLGCALGLAAFRRRTPALARS